MATAMGMVVVVAAAMLLETFDEGEGDGEVQYS